MVLLMKRARATHVYVVVTPIYYYCMQRADSIRMLTQRTHERMMNHESNHQSRTRHVQKRARVKTPPMTPKNQQGARRSASLLAVALDLL
jgi:hypothetical protein